MVKERSSVILLLAAILFPVTVFASGWTLPIVKVIDGDTIQTNVSVLPYPLSNVKIRIKGIDTPEKGHLAKCEYEQIMGTTATKKLIELIGSSKQMVIKNFKHDKYGGRYVADVFIGNVNVGEQMIELGLAKPYDGGKKGSWCD